MTQKVPYVCGPLTELNPKERQDQVKQLYSDIATLCRETIGVRGFAPHESFDPVRSPHFKDTEVYDAEEQQLTERTSLLLVVCEEPSWGGGAEIALAAEEGIPVLFLVPGGKKVSRYITGLTKRKKVYAGMIYYGDHIDALSRLREWLHEWARKKEGVNLFTCHQVA